MSRIGDSGCAELSLKASAAGAKLFGETTDSAKKGDLEREVEVRGAIQAASEVPVG